MRNTTDNLPQLDCAKFRAFCPRLLSSERGLLRAAEVIVPQEERSGRELISRQEGLSAGVELYADVAGNHGRSRHGVPQSVLQNLEPEMGSGSKAVVHELG